MKKGGILNSALSGALAALGHTDMLLVCDAGFPISVGAQRIDLALAANLPDLRTVLRLLNDEMIVESVVAAAEIEEFNNPLFEWLKETFADAALDLRPQEEMLSTVAQSAKAVVRTGSFDPWGTIGLRAGIDVPKWFSAPGVKAPDHYRDRLDSSSV